MMSTRVLVVEDEPVLLETLEYNLSRQGYKVSTAADGLAGLELARNVQPDVMVLDLMLPKLDGLEVCRTLRQESSVPIIMLTARTDEVDRVMGLEMGADDYLTKPFSMRELLARIKSLLRRVEMIQDEVQAARLVSGEPEIVQLRFDDLIINLARHEVLLNGNPVHLKPKEYDLLAFLARRPGVVLSREVLLENVWGWTFEGDSRTVDVHIRWLRQKIEANPAEPTRIVTVRRTGYRFEA